MPFTRLSKYLSLSHKENLSIGLTIVNILPYLLSKFVIFIFHVFIIINPTIELPSVNVPNKKKASKKVSVTAENQALSTKVLILSTGDKGNKKLTLDDDPELQ